VQTDALARARAEQETIVRELGSDKGILRAFSEGASSELLWQWHELC
jgi:hypothetical protein